MAVEDEKEKQVIPKSRYNPFHPGLSFISPGSSNEAEVRDQIKAGLGNGVTDSGNWFWPGSQLLLDTTENQ